MELGARTERRRRGDEAEQQACEQLARDGYEIHARNVSCRFGELDVVAEKNGILCFVEVRMRATALFGDPALTISRAKQRRVVLAAYEYLRVTRMPPKMLRFDVVTVLGEGEGAVIEHIPNAFDAGYGWT